MLQVRHLTKRYVTKGETVVALDDVSVNFPEKGMVFLLGKSGSGKSTLLHIAGGLDSPDEGEVIVKGKSSKDFSKSDFDSYRNTYVGFIFQEYNILSELTVAENVALALELQGKPRDEEHVNELLKQVDLDGYGDRRPGTLSGGQRQRVAIARALVKNPEIIMGDEPTGALDSATGKQVFDTLKKLSEEKLVVIVSHDRDFAESYADRIIELRDGKIVSDVTRGGATEGDNLIEVSEKKIALNSGTAMTHDEEERVLAFLRRNKGSVVISSDAEDLSGVTAGGGYVGFGKTVEEEMPDEKDESSFIKSKFPWRYALKMGFSGLRAKPLRLVFTTLLATIAFIVFGVFSTLMTFNVAEQGADTLTNSTYSAAVLTKYGVLHMQNGDRTYINKLYTGETTHSRFTPDEIEALQNSYPEMQFIPAYTMSAINRSYVASIGVNLNDYYDEVTSFTAFANASDVSQFTGTGGAMELVAGRLPEAANECAVSSVVYDAFVASGYRSGEVNTPVASYDDLIGKELTVSMNSIGRVYITITGIFDTHEDFSAYEVLQNGRGGTGMTSDEWLDLKQEFNEHFTYSMAGLCVVGDGFYAEHAEDEREYADQLTMAHIISAVRTENFVSSNYITFTESGWYELNPAAETGDSYVQYLFAPLAGNRSVRANILMRLDGTTNESTDVGYEAPYSFMSGIREGQEMFSEIYLILGIAAVALAIFAALLLFNFISASIHAKRKDIGILRAVGARGIDVFKIFVIEGIVVTLFCFALGCLGSLIACSITNSVLISQAVLEYALFDFGWKNVLIVLAISLVTALVSTSLPVALTVRKRPVEAIRSAQ